MFDSIGRSKTGPAQMGDLLDTRRPRLLLLAFCLLVWLPGFFTLPPTDRDESRFAQASKQMVETGDYIRIMNGTVPRNLKPIGIYWLQVPFEAAARAMHLATANPVWPYRIPSLAGGLLAVLATYEIGLAMGDRRAALLAAGCLGASVILVVETHMAKTDAALVGVTTVAMAVLARAYAGQPVGRSRAAVFWLAMGAGILLKGPITPMVAGLAAATLAVADRRGRWLLALRPVSGVLLTLLVVVPWFIAIGLATHGAFFGDAVGGDLGRKLASGDDAHGAPPGFHLLLLPLLAFPATVPVLRSLPGWWRLRREPAERFLLAWIVPAWLVFEAVPTKLPHYTLPLYPAIFLLAARIWTTSPARPSSWWATRAVPGVTLLAAAILGVGAALLPLVIHAAPLLGLPALLAAGLAGWLAVRTERPTVALAAMPLLTAALLGWELPHATPLWLAPRIEQALTEARLADRPMAAVGFHEPSLMLLAGTATIMSATGVDGAQAIATGQAATAAVASPDEASFQGEAARLGLHLRALATLSGFNYSRGRETRLTLYRAVPGGTAP
jgi:4-amino-4-deoxy-L-arabinose transferase-like glycosyltransferase